MRTAVVSALQHGRCTSIHQQAVNLHTKKARPSGRVSLYSDMFTILSWSVLEIVRAELAAFPAFFFFFLTPVRDWRNGARIDDPVLLLHLMLF